MKNAKYIAIAVMVICGILIFFHSENHQWTGDDLVYGYLFDDNHASTSPQAESLHHITTIGDVMRSQIYHYFNINGRMPVHTVIQFFDGLLGHTAFAIANTFIFIIFLWLTVRLALHDTPLRHPWACLLTAIALMMLFPSVQPDTRSIPWASISISVNYMWTCVLLELFLLKFHNSATSKNTGDTLGIILLGILTGWSNEAIALPLSGALFLMILTRRLTRRQIFMTVALWAGTALVVFAPGTIKRAITRDSAEPFSQLITSTVQCYMGIIVFWLLIIALITIFLWRKRIVKEVFRQNRLLCYILVIAIIFSIYAHSYAHSLIVIELISLILLWRLILPVIPRSFYPTPSVSVVILIAFTAFQTALCINDYKASKGYNEMVIRYLASPDGITYLPDSNPHPIIRPFVSKYNNRLSPQHYTAPFFMAEYNRFDKAPLSLTQADYTDIILRPDSFFTYAPRIDGDLDFRTGQDYYFARISGNGTVTDSTIFTARFDDDSFLAARPWIYRLYYHLAHNGKKAPKPLESQIIATRHDTIVMLRKINSVPSRITIAPQ
ncbi:MAG: hypothetical protein K2M94_07825 [Paramuribaculum sp.]|nr:hypothetical protein [Paramuribaculum sp.]